MQSPSKNPPTVIFNIGLSYGEKSHKKSVSDLWARSPPSSPFSVHQSIPKPAIFHNIHSVPCPYVRREKERMERGERWIIVVDAAAGGAKRVWAMGAPFMMSASGWGSWISKGKGGCVNLEVFRYIQITLCGQGGDGHEVE